MEIVDNSAEFKRNREEKEKTAPVCRVCGSKTIHSATYSNPTMGCIEFMRLEISRLQKSVETLVEFNQAAVRELKPFKELRLEEQ